MKTLDERIAETFSTIPKSDVVALLIIEVKKALADASKAAEAARERALDPTLTTKEIAEARKQMDDAAFARDRLKAALPRLNERLKELKASEEDGRRWVAYKKLEVERDEIAEQLKEYPALAKRIAAIVERLAANDVELDRLNNFGLPSGAKKLRSAELVARNLSTFSPAQFVAIPRIGQETRLVRFEYDKANAYLWPRPAPHVDPSTYSFPKGNPPPVIEYPQSRHIPNPVNPPKRAAGGQS